MPRRARREKERKWAHAVHAAGKEKAASQLCLLVRCGGGALHQRGGMAGATEQHQGPGCSQAPQGTKAACCMLWSRYLLEQHRKVGPGNNRRFPGFLPSPHKPTLNHAGPPGFMPAGWVGAQGLLAGSNKGDATCRPQQEPAWSCSDALRLVPVGRCRKSSGRPEKKVRPPEWYLGVSRWRIGVYFGIPVRPGWWTLGRMGSTGPLGGDKKSFSVAPEPRVWQT